MAFFDNSLLLSNAQSAITTATTTLVSSSLYDITGAGAGTAPNQLFGGAFNSSLKIGADMFLGKTMFLYFTVTTAFSTGTGTFTVNIQSAPQTSATVNTAGTYVTLFTSQAFTAAQMSLGSVLVVPIPPVAPIKLGETLPRFYQFTYAIGTATFSAGAFTAGILLDVPTGLVSTLYPNNFASGL